MSTIKLHTILVAHIALNVILRLGKLSRFPQLLHRPKYYLEKKLIEIMTSPTNVPLCISENWDLFQQVMEEFYNYECTVS